MEVTTEFYSFIKGEEKDLDEILGVEGLGGGDWWDHVDDDSALTGIPSDNIIITKSIRIEIKVMKTDRLTKGR
jgi:hypothetical protein